MEWNSLGDEKHPLIHQLFYEIREKLTPQSHVGLFFPRNREKKAHLRLQQKNRPLCLKKYRSFLINLILVKLTNNVANSHMMITTKATAAAQYSSFVCFDSRDGITRPTLTKFAGHATGLNVEDANHVTLTENQDITIHGCTCNFILMIHGIKCNKLFFPLRYHERADPLQCTITMLDLCTNRSVTSSVENMILCFQRSRMSPFALFPPLSPETMTLSQLEIEVTAHPCSFHSRTSWPVSIFHIFNVHPMIRSLPFHSLCKCGQSTRQHRDALGLSENKLGHPNFYRQSLANLSPHIDLDTR